VMRDPASYAQFGYWIAHHGSLPIPADRAAFGSKQHALSFNSLAFYQVGRGHIVPQFMAGLPMVLALGYWIGGLGAALAMAPVLGACAVLTFGGLAARLVGPRWAPAAALVLAIALPEQFTSRATYSEPLVQVLFLGGLCLVIDSFDANSIGARVTAAIGGLALGLTILVRIDGASDILPVIPYCGLLLIGRRQQAMPLITGLIAGAAYGAADGLLLSRPYLTSIKTSVYPLALTGLVVTGITALAVAALWLDGPPRVRGKWLPNAIALLPIVVITGFAIRPYLQTVRAKTDPITAATMAGYQQKNHLPVDPTRTYAEITLHWVIWYVGVPAVVLGTFAAALLSRRCLRGNAPTWTLPLMVFAWVTVTCLYRPAITPDHPWASRRLVPGVLPGFILLAVWAASWLVDRLRQRGFGRFACGALATCCAVALTLPAATTTFGLAVERGGPLGLRLAANGLAFKPTYRGEISAVDRLCAAIPRGSSVVIISNRVANLYTEVIRGMCADPTARIKYPNFKTVEAVVRRIQLAGRQPVLLATWPEALRRYGGTPRLVMKLHIRQDVSILLTPPLGTSVFKEHLWMVVLKP
jgi:hypothetical protein